MKYELEYTRDNGMIIQEIWSYSFDEGALITVGERNPFLPTCIYYIIDGVSEIWHCVEAHQWFENKVLEKNTSDSETFDICFEKYTALQKRLFESTPSSVEEFREFIELFREASTYWVYLYYTSLNDKNPQDIFEKATAFRNADEFYDVVEGIIKKTISKLFDVGDNQLVVMTSDLDNLPSVDVLKQRMNHFVYVPGEVAEIMTLKEFLQDKKYEFLFDEVSPETGQTAHPGVAKGTIRIMKRRNQVSEMKDGEVLVSPMTTPHYLPAMKKAAAIVTDEGGITCHAGIVARELKIPCVVGTKVATKFFKDGDTVEVDASEGVVKIL